MVFLHASVYTRRTSVYSVIRRTSEESAQNLDSGENITEAGAKLSMEGSLLRVETTPLRVETTPLRVE